MNLQNQLDFLPDLLDGVIVPEPIDAEVLKSEIVLECGLLRPLYSEPSVMKQAIAQWFTTHAWTFDHLVNIILAEYSPIENTDRYTTDSRTTGKNRTYTLQRSDTATERETESETDSRETSTETGTTEESSVSAFNASTYQPSSKKDTAGTGSGEESGQRSGERNLTHTGGTTESHTEGETGTDGYTAHTHGNIGVTTNQELITQELALLQEFNIYTWIARELRSDLFLEVF